MPHKHYSNDSATKPKTGEFKNSGGVYVQDCHPIFNGYPQLSDVGVNSNVRVFNQEGKLIRIEDCHGNVIKRFK